jgi:hypothetical protein
MGTLPTNEDSDPSSLFLLGYSHRLQLVQKNTAMKDETLPTASPSNWPEVLTTLQKEQDDLKHEVVQIRTERDQLAKALIDLMREEVALSQEEILAQIGGEKPLREFLEDLRAEMVQN